MTYSMTGFGRSEVCSENYKITIELKSVNHRYLDISVRLPKKLNFFETMIRNECKKYCKRGKVDIFVSYETEANQDNVVKYNRDIAASYLNGLMELSADLSLDNRVDALTLSRFPEVFTVDEQEMNEDEISSLLVEAMKQACEKLLDTRKSEGDRLVRDIQGKLDDLFSCVETIEKRSPEIVTEYQHKLLDKVNELLQDKQIDESVLATELIVYSDKICVDEETVRLRSHIQSMKQTLVEDDSVGRKLDFIAQEMNREANTILSKANDIEVSNQAIYLKTEIEKIREQIQNIE